MDQARTLRVCKECHHAFFGHSDICDKIPCHLTTKRKQENDWKKYKEQGRIGGKKEYTWNGTMHICCSSLTHWLHKKDCPGVKRGGEILEELKKLSTK